MKILYVEDNDDNVFVLQMRFELEGDHDLIVAGDGEAGFVKALETRPDIILMDVNLPGIDGLEATRRIKAQAETSAIPVIALTSNAMMGDREKALAAGCDDFDTKPVDFDRLMQKIARLVPID
jgi:two-component system cell cycle response regulator DivK